MTTYLGLDAWIKRCENLQLPMFHGTAVLLAKELKLKDVSASQIAPIIKRDPVFCLHILREANRRMAKSGTEIKTLEHAISMLGLKGVVGLVKHAKKIKINSKSMSQRRFLQSISNSIHAAEQASRWYQEIGRDGEESIYWSTLLAGSPYWMLWHIAVPEMLELEYQHIHNGVNLKQAEVDVFGCEVSALARHLSRSWHMPKATEKAWESARLPSFKELIKLARPDYEDTLDHNPRLKLQIKNPESFIYFANTLAHTSYLNWYSKTSWRFQNVIANLLHVPLDDMISKLHKWAAQISRIAPLPSVILPAFGLLNTGRDSLSVDVPIVCVDTEATMQLEKIDNDDRPLAADEKAVIEETLGKKLEAEEPATVKKSKSIKAEIEGEKAKESQSQNKEGLVDQTQKKLKEEASAHKFIRKADEKELEKLVKLLAHEPDSFGDIHHVMNTCLKALSSGIGFKRSMIMLLNSKKTGLKVFYGDGLQPKSPLATYSCDMTKPNFFSKILKQPASLHVKDLQYQKIAPLLPNDLAKKLGVREFAIMSLYAGQKPIGLAICDVKGDIEPISQKEYSNFKRLCHATCVALDVLAKEAARRQGKG